MPNHNQFQDPEVVGPLGGAEFVPSNDIDNGNGKNPSPEKDINKESGKKPALSAEHKVAENNRQDKGSDMVAILAKAMPEYQSDIKFHSGSHSNPGAQVRISFSLGDMEQCDSVLSALKGLGVSVRTAFHRFHPFLIISLDKNNRTLVSQSDFCERFKKKYSVALQHEKLKTISQLLEDVIDKKYIKIHDGSNAFPGKQLRVEMSLGKLLETTALLQALIAAKVNVERGYHGVSPFLIVKSDQYERFCERDFMPAFKEDYTKRCAFLKSALNAEKKDEHSEAASAKDTSALLQVSLFKKNDVNQAAQEVSELLQQTPRAKT